MENQQFETGAWVKKKDGTRGMTVVGYAGGDERIVKCKYTDEEGNLVEKEFPETDLVSL